MAELHQRVGGDTCAKCRKKFKRGDRITMAYIVENVGVDPKNILQRGVHLLADEFEFMHCDCANPGLEPGGILV